MATEFNPGGAGSLNAAVKARYEGNADTNAYTDAEKTKLTGVAANATANTGALADLNTVDTAQIEDGAITAPKIPANQVTYAKMQNMTSDRILGRVTASAGDPEELTAAQVITLLGVLTSTLLASNANAEGASLIGIEDAGGFATATDVEGAIQEILAAMDNYGDIVSQNQAAFVKVVDREVAIFDAGGDNNAVRPNIPSDHMVIWFNAGVGNPTNALSFDMVIGAGDGIVTPNIQSGLAYTLTLADRGQPVDMTNAAANVVTIPDNATTAFEVGSVIGITQLGAGQTTITGDTGVTLNGSVAGSVAVNIQRGGVALRKIATDEWIAQGAI